MQPISIEATALYRKKRIASVEKTAQELAAYLRMIGDYPNRDGSAKKTYLSKARNLFRSLRCHIEEMADWPELEGN